MSQADPWVSLGTAAKISGRARPTILSAALDGRVQSQRIAGQRLFIREDVERLRDDPTIRRGRRSPGKTPKPRAPAPAVGAPVSPSELVRHIEALWSEDGRSPDVRCKELRRVYADANAKYALPAAALERNAYVVQQLTTLAAKRAAEGQS